MESVLAECHMPHTQHMLYVHEHFADSIVSVYAVLRAKDKSVPNPNFVQ